MFKPSIKIRKFSQTIVLTSRERRDLFTTHCNAIPKAIKGTEKRAAKMCYYCGYMPPMMQIPLNGRCPKCLSFSWEQLTVPRRIFELFG